MSQVPPEIADFTARYGIPSVFAVAAWWAAPKLLSWFKTRLAIAQQSDDLARAGIGGMNDVVSTLRTQISDLTQQFKDVQEKLTQMSATLDEATKQKLIAENEAAKAKTDLFVLQLYVERLKAQIQSLGATPVTQE